MKKLNRIYSKLKNKFILILIIILLININAYTFIFAKTEELSENTNENQMQSNNTNIVRIADASTVDDYKENLNIMGGRYNGRVWTDKSVYANNGDGQVTLDNKFNIQYDDDFLTVFSALGSSQSVKQMTALDISMIIDMSGSMGTDVIDQLEHDDEQTRIAHSRIQATVNAVNNAIDKLMNDNEKNRVCVVVYGGTAYTLMELGHYTKVENSNEYITVEDFKSYNERELNKSGSCAYTLRAHAKKDGNEIINRTVRNNYTNNMPYEKRQRVGACIGYNTNMQAGIYKGFQELYDKADSEVMRIPAAIIMTDGASNYSLKNSSTTAGTEWYNVPIVNSLTNYNNIYKKYRTESNEVGKGGRETILDILMTASYMKVKVQKKYEEIFKQSGVAQYNDSVDFKIHTISVDTTEMISEETTKWQVPRVYTTLNPKEYFKEDLTDVNWDFKQDSIDAYKLWKQWQESPTGISTNFYDADNNRINFKINKLQEDNEVTNEEVIRNIYYNDTFRDSKSEDIEEFFSEVISSTEFNPIGNDDDETKNFNDLSYVDPIGKYMEIKEIKELLLFGKEYNIIKDGEPIVEKINEQEISKQYYKVVDSNNNDLEIINPSYEKEVKFKLSEIKIWDEKSKDNGKNNANLDYDESLHIVIPNNAIPIYLDIIKLNEFNQVDKYETNKMTDYILPIRVIYTVGISSQIINEDNEIDLTKVSEEYLSKETEEIEEDGVKKKNTYFYSNYYSGETYGDASITFMPSSDNRFYVFQKNLTIYKKSSGGNNKGEGELKETGGNVLLSDPVTDLDQIDPEETYYFAIDYYVPEEKSDGTEGRYVQYATSHKGKEFFGENGESYLTYYDTVIDNVVNNKGTNVVVVTKKGSKRIGDLNYLANKKESNTTKTADIYYAPDYGDVQENERYNIVTYLGNNGKLAVQEITKENNIQDGKNPEEDGRIPSGKLPQTGRITAIILIIVIVNLIGVSMIFYVKYKKYNFLK